MVPILKPIQGLFSFEKFTQTIVANNSIVRGKIWILRLTVLKDNLLKKIKKNDKQDIYLI